MARKVDEWKGKTDDSMPPPKVRLRIFQAHKGICHISGKKLTAADEWDLDHIVALADGGLNVESNLAPAWRPKHREKTAKENTARAKVRKIQMKHLGIKQKKPWSKYKKRMDGTVINRETGEPI